MNRDFQRWQMEAKAAGYPLCKDCREPIPKGRWGTSDRCRRCAAEYAAMRPRVITTETFELYPGLYLEIGR